MSRLMACSGVRKRVRGKFFAHFDCWFAPPHLGVYLPTPADRYTSRWVQREL
jgi:hypothetical protein